MKNVANLNDEVRILLHLKVILWSFWHNCVLWNYFSSSHDHDGAILTVYKITYNICQSDHAFLENFKQLKTLNKLPL